MRSPNSLCSAVHATEDISHLVASYNQTACHGVALLVVSVRLLYFTTDPTPRSRDAGNVDIHGEFPLVKG